MLPIIVYEVPNFSSDIAAVEQVLSASVMAQSSRKLDNGKTLVRCLSKPEAFVGYAIEAVYVPFDPPLLPFCVRVQALR
ncbi:hypothetical protein ACO0LG_16740 [Undibacterium sp. Ji42W]|uniref:hypothetical protein n=1 Tax=Undibacterium sp. Ji42W TaxID=3413039 RepID=UPI003BF13471